MCHLAQVGVTNPVTLYKEYLVQGCLGLYLSSFALL